MEAMFPVDELGKALLTLAVAVLTLFLTWGIGQSLIYKWNIKQKYKETDILAINHLTEIHGALLEIWRVWRYQKKTRAEVPLDTRDELFVMCARVEGRVEAALAYIISQRQLGQGDLRHLGLFRQACQVFRESIMHDLPMDYSYSSKEMVIFRSSFLRAIEILERPRATITEITKLYNLARVVSFGRDEYLAELEHYPPASDFR